MGTTRHVQKRAGRQRDRSEERKGSVADEVGAEAETRRAWSRREDSFRPGRTGRLCRCEITRPSQSASSGDGEKSVPMIFGRWNQVDLEMN